MIQRFFIRPAGADFAIIVVVDGAEQEVERGGKPLIRGKFLHYVKDRNALIEKVGAVAS
ncbi:hypothetical protein SAMN02799624_05259 [Paenibacillus sp. UNC496MF]|uniref:hypothetical protein n=1 Tax=Paenibacillus sp. UNC496MF TaxID=1502753 RepID=UPI0008F0814E|nr:hypothetical protein [Paenibacillus sp. UNC496MF]SFJ63054.1 hypothetical protein SAMN02799624_05259 [Paenibacillus sp. UNC496MF]